MRCLMDCGACDLQAGPLGSGMAGAAGGNGTSGSMEQPYGASAKGAAYIVPSATF